MKTQSVQPAFKTGIWIGMWLHVIWHIVCRILHRCLINCLGQLEGYCEMFVPHVMAFLSVCLDVTWTWLMSQPPHANTLQLYKHCNSMGTNICLYTSILKQIHQFIMFLNNLKYSLISIKCHMEFLVLHYVVTDVFWAYAINASFLARGKFHVNSIYC